MTKKKSKSKVLSTKALLDFSKHVVSEITKKDISFFVGDDEFTATVGVKVLTYDEVVNLMRGKDPQKELMADLVKIRLQASIFDLEKEELMFSDLESIGGVAPQIIDALHKASDEVNDFSGKYLMEKLTKKSSGANSSAAESVEEPLKKQSEE